MNTQRTGARRSIALGSVLLLGVGIVAGPSLAQSADQEDFRTEVPELGGYTAEALSSPISVLLFEPVVPVPAGPGEPHGEMHGSYSRATLGTGPASRGLGSAIWPGSTAGDGLSAFDPNIPPYPFKASATYPDGPFEAGASDDPQQNRGDGNTHTGMFAYAKGIDVYGESNGGGELIPTVVTAGDVSTVSSTTVIDGVVVAETIAAVSDLSILGGIITMDGMQTRLVARSNGEVAETEGVYEVSGLEIMGVAYEFTENGVKATAPEECPSPAPCEIVIPIGLGNQINLSDAIGVKVEAAPIDETIDGPSGRRSTRGVTITIDSSALRQAVGFLPLADVIGAIPDPIQQDVIPCSSMPPQMSFVPCYSNPLSGIKANLFTVAALQPEFKILLGGAQVSTTASLPFAFTPPPLPALAPPPPSQPSTTGTTFSVPTPSFVSPPSAPVFAEQAPQVAGPSGTTVSQVVALAIPEGLSGGLSAGLFLFSLAGIGLVARGGRRLTMAAMYGTGGAATVGAGAVPDLRAFRRGEAI